MNPGFMTDKTNENTVFAAIPDPWYVAARSAEPLIPSLLPVSLDPDHELEGSPQRAVLAAVAPGEATLLTEGESSEVTTISFLLEEELKLPVGLDNSLRDGITDAIVWLELAEHAAMGDALGRVTAAITD
jgi:hypothetical protein